MTDARENGRAAIHQAVSSAVEKHGAKRTELVPILIDINDAFGYLPAEALEEISSLLRVPKSQLFSVAGFYQMLSTKKRGKHVVQFCESAPCHVAGGQKVWTALLDALNLKAGETSADGQWTLLTTSCLGACGVGPVMVVDEDIFGNVTPDQIPGILARYQ
jgi:NADH-quinone oxidoreductase subunit E